MIPQPFTLDGRSGTIVYMDAHWQPVPPEQATMAKAVFDDGSVAFFTATENEPTEGLGGLTRKFDAALHPRGEDGRFIEASQPRIFNRPSELAESKGWGGDPVRYVWKDPQTGESTGHLLTGEPIAPENVPKTLYHVTTAASAVESSGVLLGLLEDGGLGGGQAPGVSFTSDPQDAVVIQRELRRAVQIARGELTIEDLDRFAREDEHEAGLSEGALKKALAYGREQWDSNVFTMEKTFLWDKDLPEGQRGWIGPPPTPEEKERLRRSLVKEAFSAYLQVREETAAKALGQKEWPYSVPLLKNPLILGRQEYLAKLKPEDIQTLTVESAQIPVGALVTTGSDKFLHEVRVYADVPRPKRLHSIAKYDPSQLRDERGRWATGSSHLGTEFFHGTAQGFLEDILRDGLSGEKAGRIHSKDQRNRVLALPGHVYMTTDLEEAKKYADSAGGPETSADSTFLKNQNTVLNPVYAKGYPRVPEYQPSYDAGTEIGGELPAVLTIELPQSVVKKLRKDKRSDIQTPFGGSKRVVSQVARSYKGTIKPEWIKSISYQTRDMTTGETTWHTIDAKDYKKPGPTTPPYLPQPPGWEVSPAWTKYLEQKKVASEDGSVTFYIPLIIPVQSVAKKDFDESLHPRNPAGSDKGGEFTETGRVGAATPDPVLAGQAKAGIAKVEILLPEAVKTADYGTILTYDTPFGKASQTWGDVDQHLQAKVHTAWAQEQTSIFGGHISDEAKLALRKEFQDKIQSHNQPLIEEAKSLTLKFFEQRGKDQSGEPSLLSQRGPLDPTTFDYGKGVHRTEVGLNMAGRTFGRVDLDLGKLRYASGDPLTATDQQLVKQYWDLYYDNVYATASQDVFMGPEYSAGLDQLEAQAVEAKWDKLSDKARYDYMRLRNIGDVNTLRPREPVQWTTGVERGGHSDEDYKRTNVIAKKLTELRTDQLRAERGLLDVIEKPVFRVEDHSITVGPLARPHFVIFDKAGFRVGAAPTQAEAQAQADTLAQTAMATHTRVDSSTVIEAVWRQWKLSSSGGLSLSLQLAAAQELGGVHRLNDVEVEEALKSAEEVGGIENLKAYVRAQWEVTQMVMQKAGEDKVQVYRGLMLDGEKVNATANVVLGSSGQPLQPPSNIKVVQTSTETKPKTAYRIEKSKTFSEKHPSYVIKDAEGVVIGSSNTVAQATANAEEWVKRQAESPIKVTETVTFDYDDQHLTVEKERLKGPDSWDDVPDSVQKEFEDKWVTHVTEMTASATVDIKSLSDQQRQAFATFPNWTKLSLLRDWRRVGRIEPMPFESTETAVARAVRHYHESNDHPTKLTKLPELQLQRSGAQSTTGTAHVANGWGGVGNLPPDPTRVVLRVEAPPTSVLSLPVYGQNSQEEHESVLLGTKDKWLWDAWRDEAPTFQNLPIHGKPKPKPTAGVVLAWGDVGVDYDSQAFKSDILIVDLQAEDRGKPHWLSSVNWTAVQLVAKKDFDEALHPREPAGSGDISGQFTASGHVGEPASDPALVKQAQAGIATVEKLLPKATEEADYSNVAGASWDDVEDNIKNEVRSKWENEQYENGVDVDTTYLDKETKEGVQKDNQKILDAAVEGTLRNLKNVDPFKDTDPTLPLESGGQPIEFKLRRELDPDTLDYGAGDHEEGTRGEAYVELDLEALRFTSGEPLTSAEQKIVKDHWDAVYQDAYQQALEKAFESDTYSDQRNELEQQQVSEEWNNLSDEDKYDYLIRTEGRSRARLRSPGEPDQWVTGVEKGVHEDENYARTHAIALKLTQLRTDELRRERGLTEPMEKPTFTVEKGLSHTEAHPNYIAKDAAGHIVASAGMLELATTIAEDWARDESEKYLGVPTHELIENVWSAWKHKSSEGLGLSLQLAAAREFDGLHRMTPEEVKSAEQIAESYGGIPTLQAYVRAQWEVTQMVMAKAGETKVEVYRGLMLAGERVNKTLHLPVDKLGAPLPPPTNVQVNDLPSPHVSFDFDGEHFVVPRERVPAPEPPPPPQSTTGISADEVLFEQVMASIGAPPTKEQTAYEQMMAYHRANPLEPPEVAIQRRMAKYLAAGSVRPNTFTKLPEIPLRRAGAQSSTGTRSVANDWAGVGKLPPDPTRVVLRIQAPSTSVLSLPVYGQNEQSEHESVIIGTKDRWLWDAWRHKAPDFTSQPIATRVRKAETVPLIIDLQEEDRDKPHWLSSVNWSTVQSVAKTYLDVLKWEESEHPREPQGSSTGGQFTSTASASDAGAGGGRGSAVSSATPVKGRPDAVPAAQAIADAYNARQGLPPVQHGYVAVDEPRAGTIADAYDALPEHDEDNPAVQAAYEALATEIQAQWDHILASGVEMVPWTKEGQPYATSTEMADDVRVNKRLYFFTGGDPNRFMAKADANGLTINDKFRAVHDFFGHAAGGYGFGARGEENAWVSHSQMLSPQARRALTTETRGQNSWVNFGRQNYHPDGTYKNIPPGDRPFATQKAALLPDIYALLPGERALKWDEADHPRDEVGQFTRVAMTSQRPDDDPEHKENKEVFKHMRAFEQGLKALPGVSRVSVKPGVGGWNGGSESMWQIYYRGNGEARKLVARTAKQYNQDSVLVLNKCEKGGDCQPAVELFFKGGISPQTREHIHATLLAHGITGWTWMKRDGKSLLRMVNVPPWSTWGADGVKHQQATATISRELHEYGIDNFRKVHKVAVSVMEREGAHSYDAIIGR